MCGIVGVVARSPVNQILYDGLTVLQHRGQDAAGIVTAEGHSFHMHKGRGLVRDVFRTRDMRGLVGYLVIASAGTLLTALGPRSAAGTRKQSKVMLLFPPEWVPTAPYLALPSLTAVLREDGPYRHPARYQHRDVGPLLSVWSS